MGDGADAALDRYEDEWEYNQMYPDDPDNVDPYAEEFVQEVDDPDYWEMPQIDKAEKADLAWVVALDKQSFGHASWSRMTFREELDRRGARLSVIRKRAYIQYRKWGTKYWIIGIAVNPRYRQMGLGRHLMRHVIDEASNCESFMMFLEVNCANNAAIRLYEDLGFVVTDRMEHYYGKDEHAFEMVLIG